MVVIGNFSRASRGSLCTISFPLNRLPAAYGGERSTFCTLAPMATILKVSRVGFEAQAEYGIFSTTLKPRRKNQ
jgi:hypothetical protein